MTSDERPSKKQRELLSFIEAFIAGHGYGPSYREIMRSLHYKSVSTVATHIDNLITKGHLRKRDRSARSIEVVNGVNQLTLRSEVTKAQEKWLVDLITRKFDLVENNAKPSQKSVDNLYVLVGALQVLGLGDATRAFKARLINLKSE